VRPSTEAVSAGVVEERPLEAIEAVGEAGIRPAPVKLVKHVPVNMPNSFLLIFISPP
jgi:hypothetical protein